jgi:hypothetical protein
MASGARKLDQEGEKEKRRGAPRLVCIEPGLRDERTAEREVEALPADALADLPLPTTLYLQVPGRDGPIAVATSRERADAEREAHRTVLGPEEWSALVTAVESDRLWPADFRDFCARKAADPSWVLDLETALAGARRDPPRHWTVGKVLSRIGARLVHVKC